MTVLRAVTAVAASRGIEQLSLMVAALVVAAGSEPRAYAGAALLFTALSAASTLADVGTGYQVLRARRPGIPIGYWKTVGPSVGLGVAAALTGLLADGTTRWVLMFGGLLWALSACVQLARSAALRSHNERTVLHSSAGGAIVLVGLVVSLPFEDAALLAGAALTCKVVTELILLVGVVEVTTRSAAQSWTVFANQTLNFAAANIDYLVVGVVLGAESFALYVLAFRLSSGLHSVASHTVVRVCTVRLVELDPNERPGHLRRWVAGLLALGLVGSIGVALVAPPILELVGQSWSEAVAPVQVLGLLLPLRLVHGLLGAGFLVDRADATLFRLELVRTVLSTAVLFGAASQGVLFLSWSVVGIAAISTAATALVLHERTTLRILSSASGMAIPLVVQERTPPS